MAKKTTIFWRNPVDFGKREFLMDPPPLTAVQQRHSLQNVPKTSFCPYFLANPPPTAVSTLYWAGSTLRPPPGVAAFQPVVLPPEHGGLPAVPWTAHGSRCHPLPCGPAGIACNANIKFTPFLCSLFSSCPDLSLSRPLNNFPRGRSHNSQRTNCPPPCCWGWHVGWLSGMHKDGCTVMSVAFRSAADIKPQFFTMDYPIGHYDRGAGEVTCF